MIKIVNGDLLEAKEYYILHQVNCQAVMGSGIALQIKNKWPEVYTEYKHFCSMFNTPKGRLGEVNFALTEDGTKCILNCFGQLNYGRNPNFQYTDYDALKECFQIINDSILDLGNVHSIAIPYNMGCHRGGGDWNVVYKLIEDTFNSEIDITIYKYEKEDA